MANSLSSHLIDSYYTFHQSKFPFGEPVHASQLALCGPMSYNPSMHGNAFSQTSFDANSSSSVLGGGNMSMASMDASTYLHLSNATAMKIEELQAKLNRKLGPEFISQRPGPGGGPKLTYAEGWKVINLANEVFGFNGWSSNIVHMNTDYIDYNDDSKRYNVGVSAVVRVTLRDGVYHEDVGYGMLENSRSKGAALDKCKKEAVTDGIKRALRTFGNLLGNCLYDKQYTSEVIKMKVPVPKFDKDALYRRPEFDESIASTSKAPACPPPQNHVPPAPKPLSITAAVNHRHDKDSVAVDSSANVQTARAGPSAIPAHVRPVATSTPTRNEQEIPQEKKIALSTNQKYEPSTPQCASGPAVNYRNQAKLETNDGGLESKPAERRPRTNLHEHIKAALADVREQNEASIIGRSFNAQAEDKIDTPVQQPNQPNSLKGDDSFAMDSDDDAFFAAVEMGMGVDEAEADVGRPLGEEEGIGGAIDFEEGTRGEMHFSREEELTIHNTHLNKVSRQVYSNVSNVARSSLLEKSSSTISRVNPSSIREGVNQESAKPALFEGGKPRGGFRFPPGMNASGDHSVNSTHSSMAGVKRPAEMMHSRAFGQGMGLAHAPSSANALPAKHQHQQTHNRAPTAPLDTEGGHAKRMRI